MKPNRLAFIFASVLALASTSTPTLAQDNSVDLNQQELDADIEVEQYEPPDPATDPDWQAEFKGIDLSPEQESRILQLKATLNREAFGPNPGSIILGLIEMASAGERGDEEFRQSSVAAAIRRYNTGVKEVLTPEQYQQYIQNGGGEVPPTSD